MIIVATVFLIFIAPLWLIPLTWYSLTAGLAAVVMLLPAYLLRTTIGNIPTTTLELSILGFLTGAVIHWVTRGGWKRPQISKRFLWLVMAWILAWVMATIFSADQRASLGAVKAWLFDPLLVAAVTYMVVKTTAQLRVLLSALTASGTIVAVAGLVQVTLLRDTLQDGRLSSFFSPVANYAAMYLAPILVLTIGALLWKKIHRGWWGGVGLMVLALLFTVSFGGYLAFSVGLVVFWFAWPNRRQRGLALSLTGVALLLGVFVLTRTPYLAEKFNTTDRSSSLVRTQIWRTSIEMIKDHPVVGVGPNAFEPIYRQTIPRLYWPPLEWLVAQPHQLYLALWLETGLLGLMVFVVGIVQWWRALWPRWRQRDPVVISSMAALVAMLVHGFVDTPLFKNDLAIIFAVVLLLPFLHITETKN